MPMHRERTQTSRVQEWLAMTPRPSKERYKDELRKLQVELVKLQRYFIKCDDKILTILEGRDASGKDGTIKRIVRHVSPRETRVGALGKPSNRDRTSWYFQRYVPHLPAAQELVLFNRSWYNRAGVERVMGFCSEAEHEEFMSSVSDCEHIGSFGYQAPQVLLRHQQTRTEEASRGPQIRSPQAVESQLDRYPGSQLLEAIQCGTQ